MNIKKCTSLFLVFLLLVSNVGLAFEVHYCGGEIASISLKSYAPTSLSSVASCCAKKEKEASCCKDKVVHFEKKSNTSAVKAFLFQFAIPLVIPQIQSLVFDFVSNYKKNQIISYSSDANAPPLFKLYQHYIFYA